MPEGDSGLLGLHAYEDEDEEADVPAEGHPGAGLLGVSDYGDGDDEQETNVEAAATVRQKPSNADAAAPVADAAERDIQVPSVADAAPDTEAPIQGPQGPPTQAEPSKAEAAVSSEGEQGTLGHVAAAELNESAQGDEHNEEDTAKPTTTAVEDEAGAAEPEGEQMDLRGDIPGLPPPTDEPCSEELERKVAHLLELQKVGKFFNSTLRNAKGYRNPDFLSKTVEYLQINELGTNFSQDVFNVDSAHEDDYYDKIAAAVRKEAERREAERPKKGQVDFRSAGLTNPGAMPNASGLSVAPAVAGLPSAHVSALIGAQQAAAAVSERLTGKKRSKWDA
mmetsp:Transcript_5199/g.19041  ORF Transcript_5199/g.19041 Transcript_5199/m.19041 type:complete len:336 (-) Transcript_5199:947-1954(-)|eukprot:scaffold39_cov493-Prasinococcus_capsulatus_cf.AAC.2